MKTPNLIDKQRADVNVSAADLIDFVTGPITEAGLRTNISVGIQYLAAWLRGSGAVPIHNLMEDAATAEISRAQLWQWLHHGVTLQGGRTLTPELLDSLFAEELAKLGDGFAQAGPLFKDVATRTPMVEFLTLPGYQALD